MEIEAVRDLAGGLDERERTVLWSHYGLGRPARTFGAIGAELGVTGERIRQIEKDALEKLRHAATQPPTPRPRDLPSGSAALTPSTE
jgi:RNA polymerase primary sigma factor